MDVKGMIAVGSDAGRVQVFGFDQKLRFSLQNDASASSGPVSSVTLSPDNTYVAVGHATGNIHLYDLSRPAKPARTALAVTLQQVQSGQKEGHLQGSKVLHVAFVGNRHTSIVSGDDQGRAFWWSLGKVIGVESNDVVRMLGSYPEYLPDSNGEHGGVPLKRSSTLYSVSPLPDTGAPDLGNDYSFTALLTPSKLVIVGMKPTARTWYRKTRQSTGNNDGSIGCAEWSSTGFSGARLLAYSWGKCLRLLRLLLKPHDDASKPPRQPPDFVESAMYTAADPILGLQWYDGKVSLLSGLN